MKLTKRHFVIGCRVVGALMLFGLVALFVGAAFTPMPAELRQGGAYGSSVRFVDRNGAVLREVRAEGDHTRAQWVPLSETGKNVLQAIIAAEDRRYEEHVGVDPLAI